ncbi:MAG: hypothetical protein A3H57_03465 [Candidatus Taylorbacteria bacterium RIFCSPLOWO2_02_FULL_43_11]|nr:MAG: hypothetical protein A3H57_03465 [Candidatus Taylorbacteria bacterium RIFCSPLOWO2_02_FULL_43_11]
MKTNYLAEIKVRDVSKVVNDVKNIVKGSDGRVDNFQSSEKKGYISFVVPKRNFDSFRDQVEALTHRRLYSENISSENLLGTKQTIETQTTAVVSELESLNRQKDALDKKHTQTVSAINAELARIKTELTLARKNISLLIGTTTDAALLSYWRDQEGSLTSQDSVQRQKLSSENSSYSYEKKDLDNQIAYQNSSLSYLSSQDTAFMNNVETVSGSVNVQWISWWQLARVFSPIHPTWIILILAVAVVAFLYHKKYIPKIELV